MTTDEASLIAVRAIHFGAAMVLFGELLFASFIVPAEAASASAPDRQGRTAGSAEMRVRAVVIAAWACLMISGACWLALVAMQMSGRSLAALDRPTIAAVLGSTVFGRAWVLRSVLALALAGMWPAVATQTPPQRRWARVAVLVAGALLASLTWSGHANAQVGLDGAMHHLSDSSHLLAAGAWLGGLAPLAALLRQTIALPNKRALASCASTVVRFGNAAALCVAALVMTGIVNALYLLPDLDSLFGTSYGQLLLLKICVFVVMLAIAAMNRRRLTPEMSRSREGAARRARTASSLRWNVLLEQALAALVILLVAVLGVSPPPMRM